MEKSVRKSRRYRQILGKQGEEVAAEYLIKKGYVILERNYRFARGEIDIIARDNEVMVFVEVKTQGGDSFGEPEDWVDLKKQNQIGKIASAYLQEMSLEGYDCRFDVVTVRFLGSQKKIHHIEDAFWLESSENGFT